MPKYNTIPSSRKIVKKTLHANQDTIPTMLATMIRTKKRDKSRGECKHVQQPHSSFASQSSPTGIVDFEPRDSADGDAVASDGPATGSLGTFAIRNAIYGGVGEVGRSDVPASESSCDGGRG